MNTRSSTLFGAVAVTLLFTSGLGQRGRSAAFRLGELAQDHPAFEGREMVDKEDPVEVLDFMLQAGSEEPRRLHLADFVLVIEIAQPDLRRPRDLRILLGQ